MVGELERFSIDLGTLSSSLGEPYTRENPWDRIFDALALPDHPLPLIFAALPGQRLLVYPDPECYRGPNGEIITYHRKPVYHALSAYHHAGEGDRNTLFSHLVAAHMKPLPSPVQRLDRTTPPNGNSYLQDAYAVCHDRQVMGPRSVVGGYPYFLPFFQIKNGILQPPAGQRA